MNHTLNHNATPFTPQKFRLTSGTGQDLVDNPSITTPLSSAPSHLGDATSDSSPPNMRASGSLSFGLSMLDWDSAVGLAPMPPLDVHIGNSLSEVGNGTASSGSTEAMTPDGLNIDSMDSIGLPQLQLLSLNPSLGFNSVVGSLPSSRVNNNNVMSSSGPSNSSTSMSSRRNGLSTSNGITTNNENSPTNLIINYLPQSLTRSDMQMRFEAIGTLRSCKLVYGQTPHGDSENTLVSMCYGFVDYVHPLDAIQAIGTYHQAQWEKKRLRVAYASRWHVVVLNVPKWCNQDFIRKAFQTIGTVQRCLVQRDEDTLLRNCNNGLAFLDFEDRAGSKQVFDAKTVAGSDGVHFLKAGSSDSTTPIFKCRWVLFDEPPKATSNQRVSSVSDMGAAGLSSLMQRPRSDSNRFSHWTGPPSDDSLLLTTMASSTWDHENLGLFSNPCSTSRQKDLLDIDDYIRDNPGTRMQDLIGSRISSRFSAQNKARPIVKNRDGGSGGGLKLGIEPPASLSSILREVNANSEPIGIPLDCISSYINDLQSMEPRFDPDELLHVETPLLARPDLAQFIAPGVRVFLKLDNLQPTRSFKQRGIGLFCSRAVRLRGVTHLVSSSGGNAGFAAAYSARRLGARCTVVVPDTTPLMMRQLIASEGATVEVRGSQWAEANAYAEMIVDQDENACLVHPFDHPDIWEGHSTVIDEVAAQLPDGAPDVVVVAVGGGGLLNGVCEGLSRHGWFGTAVVAMETVGADCLHQAYKEGHLVKLPQISSLAKSLGAATVSKRSWDLLQESRFSVLPAVVSDAEAVGAVDSFLDDFGMLVEPACGAALSAVYSGVLSRLLLEGKIGQLRSVLVIVCGGRAATPDLLRAWREETKPSESPADS